MKNDEDKNDEVIPDWSKIDATSIYRFGSEKQPTDKKPELDQLVKQTNGLFKVFALMIIAVVIVIIVSSYY